MTTIGNPRVLLSKTAMDSLQETLGKRGENGQALFTETVAAIRNSMNPGYAPFSSSAL